MNDSTHLRHGRAEYYYEGENTIIPLKINIPPILFSFPLTTLLVCTAETCTAVTLDHHVEKFSVYLRQKQSGGIPRTIYIQIIIILALFIILYYTPVNIFAFLINI